MKLFTVMLAGWESGMGCVIILLYGGILVS
jgi:hypothetical protein